MLGGGLNSEHFEYTQGGGVKSLFPFIMSEYKTGNSGQITPAVSVIVLTHTLLKHTHFHWRRSGVRTEYSRRLTLPSTHSPCHPPSFGNHWIGSVQHWKLNLGTSDPTRRAAHRGG